MNMSILELTYFSLLLMYLNRSSLLSTVFLSHMTFLMTTKTWKYYIISFFIMLVVKITKEVNVRKHMS